MLPVIDIQHFRTGSAKERRAIADAIAGDCQSIGFFYAVNHGVPASTIAAVQSAMRQFFAQPDGEKRKVKRPHGRYRGYIPLSHFAEDSQGRATLLYESFLQGLPIDDGDARIEQTHGLLSPNLWPAGAGAQEFTRAAQDYWQGVSLLSDSLLEAFALALDLPEDGFLRHFSNQLTNISYLHYPPRPTPADGADKPASKAHYDTNALTVLLPDPVGGLEVRMTDGSWMEVAPLEGAYVVNIGNMMEAWSGGRFKSTMHRVNPPPGIERYSIGFFAVPDYDTIVQPVIQSDHGSMDRLSEPLHVGKELAKFVASCDAMKET